MITSPLARAHDARDPETPQTLDRVAPAKRRYPPPPLLPGWIVEDRISVSANAEVLRVRRAHGGDSRPRALKLLRIEDDRRCRPAHARVRALREVTVLRALERTGCAGVPRVIEYGIGGRGCARPWLVLPYFPHAMWREPGADGGWLEPYRGDVERVLSVVAALAETLAEAHGARRPMAHGDVRAGNVLFGDRGTRPVLAGFGRAHIAGAEPPVRDAVSEWARHRTTRWHPPEAHGGRQHVVDPAGDVFMLGGLLYEALSGGCVLPAAHEWDALSVHELPEYALPRVLADVSDDPRLVAVSALLRGMLTLAPERRLTARGVAYACRGILATSARRLSA